jgi:hypothetical protein
MDTPSSTTFYGSETQVVETDQGFSANVPVPIWSSKAFITQWTTPDKLLTASIEMDPAGKWQLRLNNHLSVKLTGVKVVQGGRVHTLPDLAPGESREMELAGLVPSGSFDSWLNGLATPATLNFLQGVGFGLVRPDVNKLPSWETVMPLMSFAEKIRQMPDNDGLVNWRLVDLSSDLNKGKLIVLAYAEHYPQNGLQPKFKPDRIEHHALLRCVINQ